MLKKRVVDNGFGHVYLLNKTNVLVVVGSGDNNSKYPINKVIFWDDTKEDIVGEITNKHPIKSATLYMKMLIISDKGKVSLHDSRN